MLSYILSALSVARHAVALTIVASAAATTMVAGAVDQTAIQLQEQTVPMTASVATPTKPEPTAKSEATLTVTSKSATPETSPRPEASPISQVRTAEIEALVKDCLTKYAALKAGTTAGTAASEACRRAIEASGLTSTEFWARFAPKTEPTTQPQKPTADLEALMKDCLTKYAAAKTSTTAGTAASEACRRAIEASDLTSTEFWARFAPRTEPTTAPEKPSTKPSTKPTTNPATNIETLAKYCITKYTTAKDNATEATAASEVCRRAIEASGLSATEFWAKFGTPQAPKSEPKATAAPTATGLTQLTRYCLTMHAALTSTSSHEQIERATTVCNQAIAESKLTPTEFWTKFSTSR